MPQESHKDALKQEIISVGRLLSDRRLVVASAGNLSARLDSGHILITATATSLGSLACDDILTAQIHVGREQDRRLSTEFPLHSLVYREFPAVNAVVHCHPPLINGYFAVYDDLKVLTYEAKLFLGDIPVVTQGSPSIVKPQEVIQALKSNNLAVIKNHGVVSMGRDFREALNLVETLEEAVRVAAVARLFGKEEFDSLDVQLKQSLSNTYEESGPYTMFSREHIQRIVELVNRDEFIASKGEELGLTVELAIAMEGVGSVYKFSFENGRIVRLDLDGDAPFVISAPRQVWEQVFLGRLDPFVATTQGRMKLKGELGKLARWYVPFARLFELFRQVKITQ